MKKYLCLIISLLNAVTSAIYIALIDKDIVPIHYDFYGNVDNEGSKWSFMFLTCYFSCNGSSVSYNRKGYGKEYQSSEKQ